MVNWEKEYEAIPGGFFGWGDNVGQKITGQVVDYLPNGGTDFDGEECPLVMLELTEQAWSHGKAGWTALEAGETVKVTCSNNSLNEVARMMKPGPGDLVQFELVELRPTNKGNPAKIIKGRISRSSAAPAPQGAPAPQQQQAPGPNFGAAQPPQQAGGPPFAGGGAPAAGGPPFAGGGAPAGADEPPF